MVPRGIIVFLALSPLLCAPARAQTSLTVGDSTPLAAVKAALQALKGLSGESSAKSRALLAALSKRAKANGRKTVRSHDFINM